MRVDTDFEMSGEGASDDPCSEEYAGGEAGSEPETKAYQKFVKTLNSNKNLKMYINLHSPSQVSLTGNYIIKTSYDNIKEVLKIIFCNEF